jgi:hypothetical protein
MSATTEQLWDAIDRIYNEDGIADRIFPSVVAKLIEFKMVIQIPFKKSQSVKCWTRSTYNTVRDRWLGSKSPFDAFDEKRGCIDVADVRFIHLFRSLRDWNSDTTYV